MEGYFRLIISSIALLVAGWMLINKLKLVAHEEAWDYKPWERNKFQGIAYKQAVLRYYLRWFLSRSIFVAIVGGAIILSIYAASHFNWSLPPTDDGYEALLVVFLHLLKIVAMLAFIAIAIYIAYISLFLVSMISYLYFVFSTFLQIPFILNWLMTGHYIGGIFPAEYNSIFAIVSIFNLTLSDVGDFFFFLLETISTKSLIVDF